MGVTNLGSLQLDDGGAGAAVLSGFNVYTATLTPVAVAAATVAEQTFTVAGLTPGDRIIVNGPANATSTGLAGSRIVSANTLGLRYVNPTAGSLTPTAGTFTIFAFRTVP